MDGRTVAAKISESGGGVGRNIADALGKLGMNLYLISAVGNDLTGQVIRNGYNSHLNLKGMGVYDGENSGKCIVICDHTGECLFVTADMNIHKEITSSQVKIHEKVILKSPLVVLDANLSQDTISFLLELCHENSIPVWYEPTDALLAPKAFVKNNPLPSFISPNYQEFKNIFDALYPDYEFSKNRKLDEVEECVEKGKLLGQHVDNIIITLGERGVLVIRKGDSSDPFFDVTCNPSKPKYLKRNEEVSYRFYKPETSLSKDDIVNVSGAGDCFASGFIASMLRGESEKMCAQNGFKCATICLRTNSTIPDKF